MNKLSDARIIFASEPGRQGDSLPKRKNQHIANNISAANRPAFFPIRQEFTR
jgi:hypothetical protein